MQTNWIRNTTYSCPLPLHMRHPAGDIQVTHLTPSGEPSTSSSHQRIPISPTPKVSPATERNAYKMGLTACQDAKFDTNLFALPNNRFC